MSLSMLVKFISPDGIWELLATFHSLKGKNYNLTPRYPQDKIKVAGTLQLIKKFDKTITKICSSLVTLSRLEGETSFPPSGKIMKFCLSAIYFKLLFAKRRK